MVKSNRIIIVVLLFLLAMAGAGQVLACIMCEDVPDPGEEKLRAQIKAQGKEIIPQLREIVSCDHKEHQSQKMLAIETLARFQDDGSVPILKKMVLEIINPASLSPFGLVSPESECRVGAARALRELEVMGVATEIFADWKDMPLERRQELPGFGRRQTGYCNNRVNVLFA